MPLGFHGDRYLLRLVDLLAGRAEVFVETGANVGSTLGYVARTFPRLDCLACEPDREACEAAAAHAGVRAHVAVWNETSQAFLRRLERERSEVFSLTPLAWLDAHGYGFEWPLREEVNVLTRCFASGFLLVDDFRVPHEPRFGFDAYQGQECSFEYVRDAIAPRVAWRLYLPAYSEATSPWHPLRGWGLLQFGKTLDELDRLDAALPDVCLHVEESAGSSFRRGARPSVRVPAPSTAFVRATDALASVERMDDADASAAPSSQDASSDSLAGSTGARESFSASLPPGSPGFTASTASSRSDEPSRPGESSRSGEPSRSTGSSLSHPDPRGKLAPRAPLPSKVKRSVAPPSRVATSSAPVSSLAALLDQLRADIAENDGSAELWNDLGAGLALSGDVRAALDAIAQALQRDPTHERARRNLKYLLRAARGEEKRALAIAPGAWGRSVARDPYADLRELVDVETPTIVDGGANRGETVAILRRAFPKARIHAFEPIPELAHGIRARFADDREIVVHGAALAAEGGTLSLRVLQDDMTSSVLAPSAFKRRHHGERVELAREIEVLALPLRDVVEDPIDVLKLDLQGFELEALRGLGSKLADTGAILAEVEFVPLYDGQPLFADVDAFLRAAGFRLFHLYDVWTLPEGQVTTADALYVNERRYA